MSKYSNCTIHEVRHYQRLVAYFYVSGYNRHVAGRRKLAKFGPYIHVFGLSGISDSGVMITDLSAPRYTERG